MVKIMQEVHMALYTKYFIQSYFIDVVSNEGNAAAKSQLLLLRYLANQFCHFLFAVSIY